jgi:hypothetical protein
MQHIKTLRCEYAVDLGQEFGNALKAAAFDTYDINTQAPLNMEYTGFLPLRYT